MPKLPLFKDEPLNQGIIALLRQMREHPSSEEDLAIIHDLTALAKNPQSSMSERLAFFCADIGFLRPQRLENFVINSLSQPRLKGVRAAMRLEINQWLLAHAAAAGTTLATKLTD